MKTTLSTGVSFTPAARQLDFSAVPDFAAARLYAVVNTTRNMVIFGAGLQDRGATIAGALLTLEYDTSAHEPDDVLLVIYDDPVIGTVSDAPAPDDTAPATIVALMRRGLARWTTLMGRLPAPISGRVPVDGSGVVQPISAAALPLPAGAATAANQSTGNATLASILTALQAQIELASSVWTDDSGAYFVRRDTVSESTGSVTISWTTPTGSASSGPGAGARPLASAERDVSTLFYRAMVAGSGYAIGDTIGQITIIDPSAGTVTGSIWRNLTTSTTIAAPTAAHLTRIEDNVSATVTNWPATQAISATTLPLPTGAATQTTLAALAAAAATETTLAAVLTKLGAVVLAAGSAVIGKVGLMVGGADVSTTNPVHVTSRDAIESAASVTSAATVVSLDTTGFAQIVIALTSIGTGNTISFETSGDNGVTWHAAQGQRINDGALVSAADYVGGFVFPATARLFRARVSAYGSGTVTISATLRSVPFTRMAA